MSIEKSSGTDGTQTTSGADHAKLSDQLGTNYMRRVGGMPSYGNENDLHAHLEGLCGHLPEANLNGKAGHKRMS